MHLTLTIHKGPTGQAHCGRRSHDRSSAHNPFRVALCTQITATTATCFSLTTVLLCARPTTRAVTTLPTFETTMRASIGHSLLTRCSRWLIYDLHVLTALGSDKAQDMIDQIARKYEGGPGGVARVLPMGPGMMGNMNGPPQKISEDPHPASNPVDHLYDSATAHLQAMVLPRLRCVDLVDTRIKDHHKGGPPPPQLSGPPPGFQPPPGMQPLPNFFPPTSGASASAAPTTFDTPPLPTPNGGAAPLVNGLNPERARMLGLL
ncbi:BQ5605_C030g10780 [Microbotryum silenes-dioicae]|uniref:BQ5605_C030g10780 protein n=1 Tax=Microbotryum silenes-dioicae TaxID=796604 RepID=A0A2X0PC85_9BASI|nr:BQ5605_C030g10780 [Microbotryum silenes-dioicae]